MGQPQPPFIEDHLKVLSRQAPHQTALIAPSGRLTYQELEELSSCCAAGLNAYGVSRGSRTVLMVPPGPEMLVLAFGLIKLRAVPILIDPGMGRQNLGKCLAECDPEAFVGIPKAHLARAVLGWGRRTIRYKVSIGGSFPGCLKWKSLLDLGRKNPEPERGGGLDEVAAIVFTSGSTGLPKGVVYTHRMFSAQARLLKESFDIREGEVDLATFPLFALYDPALRMTTVFPKMDFTRPGKVDPREIIEPIQRYEVTHMFGSPALLNRVGRVGRKQGIRLPSLRRVLSAGAPVSDQILQLFSEMLSPGALIHTPYGATEALPVTSISHRERREIGGVSEGKGVCVGLPLSQVELKIVRLSDEPLKIWTPGLEVPVGEIGEIAVSGDNVSCHYFRRPEADIQAKIVGKNGSILHRMGDLGYRDQCGRIWFCGRKIHRVETPSGMLFTVPCEGIFNAHPDVFRSALVGVGNRPNQKPVLCVELEQNSSADEKERIRKELLERGSRFSITREIRTILFHPGFPVDIRHNAKIFRELLAQWAEGQIT